MVGSRARRGVRGDGGGGRAHHALAAPGQAGLRRAARRLGLGAALRPGRGDGRVRCLRQAQSGRLGRGRGEVVRTKRGELSVKVASGCCWPRPGATSATSGTGCPTPRPATASARSTCGPTSAAASCSCCAATWCAACASACGTRVSSRWRHRCCTPSPAGPRPGRSSPTTTPSTWTSTCASRPSSTSSAWWSAAWTRSSRSGAASATRASRPGTTPSSPPSSSTRPTPTTPTPWWSSRSCAPGWPSMCWAPPS